MTFIPKHNHSPFPDKILLAGKSNIGLSIDITLRFSFLVELYSIENKIDDNYLQSKLGLSKENLQLFKNGIFDIKLSNILKVEELLNDKLIIIL